MFSITSIPPAVWSPAPGPAVTAVAAPAPVTPVQATSRDAQTGTGQPGRDPSAVAQVLRPGAPQAERTSQGPAVEAAPLLPRESPDAPDQPASAETTEVQAEAEREQQARQAEDKALKQQLQDVIANVWKASAAVVEVALGRESGAAEDAAVDVQAVAPAAAPGQGGVKPQTVPAALPAVSDEMASLADWRAGQEVVAYDAAGHSSLAPLEAGTLISRRV